MSTPSPTIEAIPAEVLRAVRATLPLARPDEAVLAGHGFEVMAWRVPASDGDWLLRLPRHAEVAPTLETQQCLAGFLARRGLPVPREPRVLRDAEGVVVGTLYRYAKGELGHASGRVARARLAASLAEFLSQLHAIDLDEVPCEVGRSDAWRDSFGPLIARCAGLLAPSSEAWVREVGARLERASRTTPPPVLLHADLKPDHVILGEGGEIAAVLDFDGVTASDPALDFSRLIQWWGKPFAAQVLAQYRGTTDAHLMERAQCYRDLDALQMVDTAVQRDWMEWMPWARRDLAARASAATRRQRR